MLFAAKYIGELGEVYTTILCIIYALLYNVASVWCVIAVYVRGRLLEMWGGEEETGGIMTGRQAIL